MTILPPPDQNPAPAQVPVPPAAAPQAPIAVVPGGPVIPLTGAPQTAAEVQALRDRGNELSGQLISARSRRERYVRQLRSGDPDQEGLKQQVTYLDNRILSLEQAIDQNGKLIASAAPGALTANQPQFIPPFRNRRMDPTPVFVVFILFVLAPLAFAFVWRAVKRPGAVAPPPGWNEHLQRMDRVEQAVDTIAIEIERISEGQRFLTRIMSDRGEAGAARALGAGPAEPIAQASQREAVPVESRRG